MVQSIGGGSGGAGQAVSVTTYGTLQAIGVNAVGVLAQSVGGGGGFSRSNLSQTSSTQYMISLGGSAGVALTASTPLNYSLLTAASLTRDATI